MQLQSAQGGMFDPLSPNPHPTPPNPNHSTSNPKQLQSAQGGMFDPQTRFALQQLQQYSNAAGTGTPRFRANWPHSSRPTRRSRCKGLGHPTRDCHGQILALAFTQKSLNPFQSSRIRSQAAGEEREFFIDHLLIRIHLIIKMILVDRPCAMGV